MTPHLSPRIEVPTSPKKGSPQSPKKPSYRLSSVSCNAPLPMPEPPEDVIDVSAEGVDQHLILEGTSPQKQQPSRTPSLVNFSKPTLSIPASPPKRFPPAAPPASPPKRFPLPRPIILPPSQSFHNFREHPIMASARTLLLQAEAQLALAQVQLEHAKAQLQYAEECVSSLPGHLNMPLSPPAEVAEMPGEEVGLAHSEDRSAKSLKLVSPTTKDPPVIELSVAEADEDKENVGGVGMETSKTKPVQVQKRLRRGLSVAEADENKENMVDMGMEMPKMKPVQTPKRLRRVMSAFFERNNGGPRKFDID